MNRVDPCEASLADNLGKTFARDPIISADRILIRITWVCAICPRALLGGAKRKGVSIRLLEGAFLMAVDSATRERRPGHSLGAELCERPL